MAQPEEPSSDPTGPYLGADPPERFGGEIGAHLERTRLAGLFLQSPAFMAVTRGPEHVFANANPTYLELVGGRDLLGRSVRSAFPELEGQGFFELLDQVYETGEPYVGSEEPVRLRRDGRLEELYVCYSFHPLLEEDAPWGILIHGIDVTERVRNRKTLRARLEAQVWVSTLGRRVLAATTLEEAFDDTLGAALRATGADAGEILLHRPDPDDLLLRAGVGWDPDRIGEWSTGITSEHHAGRAFRQQRPVLARASGESGQVEEEGDDGQPVSPDPETGAHLTVPIPGLDERPLGVLGVHATDPEAFDEHAVPALESVANILAAVIRRHESERFAATVAGNLPGILYRCRNDRDWTMEYLSEGTHELTGYTPEDLTVGGGPSFGDLIHPDDREQVWRRVQRALEAGRPFQLQYRVRARGGEEKWVWEQGRAVEREAGDGPVLEGCIFDITEWREAREEADRAQSLLAAAFHGLSDAAFVVRLPDRTVEWCNRAAEEMFGYPAGELEGEETRVLHVDEERWREFGEVSERALRAEGVFRGEFRMRRSDGTTFPTEHVVSWVEYEGEEPERAVSIVRDITERKEREVALRRSRELLQRYAAHLTQAREEERREVAREIHDELGQTLTAVKMKLEEVEERTAEVETRRGLAEAVEMVRSTLGQVRSLSTSLRPKVLDELGLARALSLLVDRFREQSGIEAALELPDPEVELSGGARIHVYRVVQEALTNAARHASPDRVVVRLEEDDGDLICRIEDDGMGLGGEDPLESPESRGVLGMQERAHLLGGELSISERPAGGTEVRLRVPPRESGTEGAPA